jgi:hypothetical protein
MVSVAALKAFSQEGRKRKGHLPKYHQTVDLDLEGADRRLRGQA